MPELGVLADARVLVTGAGGFLGGGIAHQLRELGADVRALQRGTYRELTALGIDCRQGDLADADAVAEACADRDLVIHVAAKAGVWGSWDSYHRPNVSGTQNILDACAQHRISRLVYTSSPSVVFNGHDELGISEDQPYPSHYLGHYSHTKAIAEQAVLAANGDDLATVALRPHLIWGPGDRHLVPRIVDRGRRGRLRLVGDGTNRIDTTYIDNAVDAHLLAAAELCGDRRCAGKAYFISNGEPLPIRDVLNRILAAHDLPPVRKTIGPNMAYGVGVMLEAIYRLLRIKSEPPMTPFVARQLATEHFFDISAAARDFDYVPQLDLDHGFRLLAAAHEASGG